MSQRLPGRTSSTTTALGRPAVLAAFITLIHALVLAGSFSHGFVMDDAAYITMNPAVTTGVPLPRLFTDRATIASDEELQWQSYRPVRTLAFRAIVATVGVSAWGFRVAAFALWGVCLFFLLRWLRQFAVPVSIALPVTLVFALAPVHVEPLVYPSALGDMVSLALQLLAIDRQLAAWRGPDRESRRAVLTALALVSSFAAMLAKEAAVVTPALLAAAWLATGEAGSPGERRRRIVELVLHGGAVVGFLALRTLVLHAVGHAQTTPSQVLGALARVPWVLGAYVKISLMPLGHVPSYILRSPPAWLLGMAWLLLLGLGALAWRRARGLALWGLLWFPMGLVPVLNLVPIAADMADRYAVLSTFGLACVAAAITVKLRGGNRRWGYLVAAVLVVLFGAGSVVEAQAWQGDALLWEKAVAVEPDSPQSHRNLGLLRLKQGRPAEALTHLDRALALGGDPRRVHYYRAMALESMGRPGEAMAALSLELLVNPRFGRAHAVMGGLALQKGDLATARRHHQAANTLEPHHPSTLMLGFEIADETNDRANALAISDQLLSYGPDNPRFLYLRARALLPQDPEAAERTSASCLATAPDDPSCSAVMGRALAAQPPKAAGARRYLVRAAEGLPAGSPEHRRVQAALMTLP